jgi:DNA-binding MarR family transcriptional regulator
MVSQVPNRRGLDFDPIEEARHNWQDHEWGDGRAMVAATSITRAHQILLAEINAALAPFDLTFSRFEVLALLFFARSNALPMGKIGSRLQVHPTSVTSLVNRLVEDGLVERVAHPTDRRTTLVTLTRRGANLTPKCAAALEAGSFGLTGLTDTQLDIVANTISSLRQASGDWTARDSITENRTTLK